VLAGKVPRGRERLRRQRMVGVHHHHELVLEQVVVHEPRVRLAPNANRDARHPRAPQRCSRRCRRSTPTTLCPGCFVTPPCSRSVAPSRPGHPDMRGSACPPGGASIRCNIFQGEQRSSGLLRKRPDPARSVLSSGAVRPLSFRAQRGTAIVPVEGPWSGGSARGGLASRTQGSFYMSGMSSMLGIPPAR
jgi:hypothetical protein